MRHGFVVGYQRWHELLFLHWPVRASSLRAQVDPRLDLDLYEDTAYVSLTPFTVRGARLRGVPPLPFLTTFHELNLRTYVRARSGEPGVWFFSLDAASAPAVALARAGLGLPYCVARMSRSVNGQTHDFRSERVALGRRPASLTARWTVGQPLSSPPGSLEHFLVERYALYTRWLGRLLRVRVRHQPWPLRAVGLERLDETVSRASGLSSTAESPLAQFSTGVDVEFFPPEQL